MGKAGLHVVPLTAEELMWLHGLTVEQGLRQGYCIKGHEKEWRAARRAALEQERKSLGLDIVKRDYCDKPKKKRKAPVREPDEWTPPQILSENTPEQLPETRQKNTTKPAGRVSETQENTSDAIRKTIQTEDYIMDKNTRILLLIHLMSSDSFATMTQTEKAILLTELLYGKDKPEPAAAPKQTKHPGGRPKKAATPAEEKTEGEAE